LKKYITLTILIFSCFYSNAQWSTRIEGNGTASISSNTAFIRSSNNSSFSSKINGITLTASNPTIVTFDWSAETFDTGGYAYDPFYFQINGGTKQYITGRLDSGRWKLILLT